MFELVPHAADVRVRVTAPSREELFADAMHGMYAAMHAHRGGAAVQHTIRVDDSADTTALLVDFLNELLARAHVAQELFTEVRFTRFEERSLEAELTGVAPASFDEDVKAVTYHEAAIRRAWKHDLPDDAIAIIYDVAHNVAKVERYPDVGEVVVHRKGATRAFPGQPVLIPGSMGTASYLLVGTESAMKQSFGSSCHGAGRVMSRTKARHEISLEELKGRLRAQGIIAEAGSSKGLVEEAPEAYKDIDAVIDIVASAGIAKNVARFRPLAVVKG